MAVNFAPAGVIFQARNVQNFIRQLGNVNRAVDDFNRKIDKAASTATKFETQINNLASGALKVLVTGLAAATLAFGALTIAGIETAASFENAFADVTKTVDVFLDREATLEAGFIQLTEEGAKFREELVKLSTDIPVTFEELSAIAGLGGQLGIVNELAGDEAREALLRFTETVAGLGEATNLTQEKAATGLAQITNIYRETVDNAGENVERLGATLVELGNTSAATESLILNFSQRIAGAGQTIGLTQAQVLGIGTAFASIGITAEAGATAVNRALLIMNEAVALSTDTFADNTDAIKQVEEEILDLNADLVRLEYQTGITGNSLVNQFDVFTELGGSVKDFGRQLGDVRREQLFKTQIEIDRLNLKLRELELTQGQAITTEVFDELFRVVQNTAKGVELTSEAFRDLYREDPAEAFALFVEGLAEEGDRAGEALDKIGLGSVEATRAFLAMAGASDLVRDRIEAAVLAFKENTALIDEVSVRYATLESRMVAFRNSIRAAADSIFANFIPATLAIVQEGSEVSDVFGEKIPKLIETLGDKLLPEFKEILEGLGLADFDISDTISQSLDNLILRIEEVDVSNLSNQALALRDTIVPIWTGAVDLATEHSDALTGAVKGLIAVLGGAAFYAAVTKAAALIGFLTTPLGLVTGLVVSLGIIWETNFLNIQEVVSKTVTSVSESISKLVDQIAAIDIGVFSELFAGPEFDLTGISMDEALIPEFEFTPLQRLETIASRVLEIVGEIISGFMQIPFDMLGGVVTFLDGLVQIFDGLNSETLILARTLGGLQTAIEGVVEALISPAETILGIFGIDFDSTIISDAIFDAVSDFVSGFAQALGAADVEELGSSFQELWASIVELGADINFTALWEGLKSLGSALIEFKDAVKELLGLDPSDSLFILFGQIAGFFAVVSIERITNIVQIITGLVVALDGLFNLDAEKIAQGFTDIGLALASIPFDLALSAIRVFAPEYEEEFFQLSLDAIDAMQRGWDEGLISMDTGRSWGQWIEDQTAQMTTGINGLIEDIKTLFSTNLDLSEIDIGITQWIDQLSLDLFQFFVDLDISITTWIDNVSEKFYNIFNEADIDTTGLIDQLSKALFQFFVDLDISITTWIDDISRRIFETLDGALEEVSMGVPDYSEFLASVLAIPGQLSAFLTNVLFPIDVGAPSFTTFFEKLVEVGIKVKTFFTELWKDIKPDIDFDFGILDKLAELGLIDIDTDTEDISDDLTMGLVRGIEDAEDTWQETWLNFLLSPIEMGKEALGIDSPSTVTQEMAQDLVEGYALGLSDLTPIEEAMIGVHSELLTQFQNLTTEIMTQVVPSFERANETVNIFYMETLTPLNSFLIDDLIPTKRELAEVNETELVPTVDLLESAEDALANTLDKVIVRLQDTISLKKKDKDRSKALTEEIKELTKAYEQLASAMEAVANASPEVSAPQSPGFQTGGSFIVPSSVGPRGMPIRVHAGELVNIVPAPQVSGASTTNMINQSTMETSSQTAYHLHVSEAPSSNVRDSFALLEALV